MKRSCQLSLFAAILSSMVGLSPPPPALAKHITNSIACAPAAQKGLLRTQQVSRRPRCEGEAVLPLFLHIALRPELMEPRYINIILGRANQSGNTGLFENYIWRASLPGKASYHLQAENHPVATECSASFSAHFQHSGLNRLDIIKELGQPARHFFDSSGHPADEYRFSDHTFLTVSEPANTFEVTQITVCYQGPHIAGPSSDDYSAAQAFRLQKAQRQLAFGNASECAKILREHLQDNPHDAPTHLLLAQTLQRVCDLNGAIDEYRTAYHLSQTQGLPHVEGEAVSGLAKIGISTDSQARQLAARNSSIY
jgi:hypothetical protein